jgi:hypothetical protein
MQLQETLGKIVLKGMKLHLLYSLEFRKPAIKVMDSILWMILELAPLKIILAFLSLE